MNRAIPSSIRRSGYGRIIDLDEAYIEVTFDSDDKKKKPSRKLLFPGSFSQGLLQIG